VEVCPAYDHGKQYFPQAYGRPRRELKFVAEITGIAAADLVHDFLSMILSEKPPESPSYFVPAKDEL
jgi:hypothetical protein